MKHTNLRDHVRATARAACKKADDLLGRRESGADEFASAAKLLTAAGVALSAANGPPRVAKCQDSIAFDPKPGERWEYCRRGDWVGARVVERDSGPVLDDEDDDTGIVAYAKLDDSHGRGISTMTWGEFELGLWRRASAAAVRAEGKAGR